MQKIKRIKRKSYAKINLFLEVIGKRKDGFHEIETVFQQVKLHDTITFTLTNKPKIKILSTEKSLQNDENIIYQVAVFIKNQFRVSKSVEIDLEKRIPIAAGLGGGSSNAAITINALSELWELDLTKKEKHNIAAQFGSDINFFLDGGTAVGKGRGEIISKLESDPPVYENILLINPQFPIRSREAYKKVLLNKNKKKYEINNADKYSFIFNRLEKGIKSNYLQINKIINKSCELNAVKSILSGSGPTVISFFKNRENALNAKKYFDSVNYWTCLTETKV